MRLTAPGAETPFSAILSTYPFAQGRLSAAYRRGLHDGRSISPKKRLAIRSAVGAAILGMMADKGMTSVDAGEISRLTGTTTSQIEDILAD